MPLYEYECGQCHKVTEELQKFSDPPLTQCKDCGGPIQKLISKSSFHLKGTGWYQTDYKKTGSASSSGSESKKSESKKSESKKSEGDGNSKKGDKSGGETKKKEAKAASSGGD